MVSPRRRRLALFGAVGLAAGLAGLWHGSRTNAPHPLEGIKLPDAQGSIRDLGEWRGKALVLNFWATWCTPCREEIPMLVEARRSYAAQGVEIIGIAVDNAANVRQFTETFKIEYPILIADASGLDLTRKLGNAAGGLPYTAFVDRSGRLVTTKLGGLSRAELDAALSKIVR